MSQLCNIESCNRETDMELCEKHLAAKNSLYENFEKWKHAFGTKYSFEKYLDELLKDKLNTGSWVKDVISLIKNN